MENWGSKVTGHSSDCQEQQVGPEAGAGLTAPKETSIAFSCGDHNMFIMDALPWWSEKPGALLELWFQMHKIPKI